LAQGEAVVSSSGEMRHRLIPEGVLDTMTRLIPAVGVRPRLAAVSNVLASLLVLVLSPAPSANAQRTDLAGQGEPKADAQTNPGQFFAVTEPINDSLIEELRGATTHYIEQVAAKGQRPILVFEFRPGRVKPGQSPFGASSDLDHFISTKLTGAKETVAYIPEPLTGYAVLAALACDEIVMGPNASLGPISPEGEPVTAREREEVRALANRKGKDADLLLGLLDKDANLLAVRTADRQTHYVLADHLDEFKKTHHVVEEQPAWEGGRRGVLTAEDARRGFAKLLADDRAKIREVYRLPSTADDPTLGGVIRPVRIKIEGPLDTIQESYLRRRIAQARQEQVNLIFFELNSPGGLETPANNIADLLSGLKDMKTVAFVNDRALGVTSLVALACDEIVFSKSGRMGDARQRVTGSGPNNVEDFSSELLEQIATQASEIARRKGHPEAIARAMVDPDVVVHQARDNKTGAVVFVLQKQVDSEPGRFVIQDTLRKKDNAPLVVDAENAVQLGVARRVVGDIHELTTSFGIRGEVRIDGPTWVDGLVTTLNTPWMSWLLLFIGLFMLILELKLPGIGLPGILSALAFLLFFWGHYLSGTADQLEIMLFLGGLVCLALELFVFPGFGVFGMSGILLILVSVVMASHTFIWPTQDYEYRQMGATLLQVTVAIVAVAGGAVVLGRYFPSLPLFNRMVLKPEPIGEPEDPTAKPSASGEPSYLFLIGETGRTTTALKPTGKARFGELLLDVTADGFYIDPNSLIEVVDVQGSKVIVKRV
jgi:membrane-bound serine protease (ClpP class)